MEFIFGLQDKRLSIVTEFDRNSSHTTRFDQIHFYFQVFYFTVVLCVKTICNVIKSKEKVDCNRKVKVVDSKSKEE